MKATSNLEEVLLQDPLLAFSLYIHVQCTFLRKFGSDALKRLDRSLISYDEQGKRDATDEETIGHVYGLFWLWLFGAYEIVRTMAEAKECFSPQIQVGLTHLKKRLEVIRMPFAKQELKKVKDQPKRPVHAELSIIGVKDHPVDMLFQVEADTISARNLISDFENFFAGITRADIVACHASRY